MKRNKKAHLIGICGAGMSAVAVLLKDAGWEVTGSDDNFFEPIPSYLKRNKIFFNKGYRAKNIPKGVDLVVIGKNVHLSPEENAETKQSVKSGVEIKSLPEVLALLSRETENTVVAGSFGKSTLTALVSWCLIKARRDPSYFIGALPVDLKNSSHLGKGKEFVLEGDEYPSSNWDNSSKFLHLNPASVILISGEHDHINIFPTEKSYMEPYQQLVAKIPKSGLLIYSKNAKNAKAISKSAKCRTVSYSLYDKKADWYGTNIKYGATSSFDLMHHGKKIVEIKTKLLGKHNLENIIGAGALLLENKKINPQTFAKAIISFQGIKRRIELLNKKGSVSVYEGFGSSYEKTRAIFDAFKLHFPERRIVAVFEPHAFSWRNRKFLKWYKDVFKDVAEVVMLPAISRGKLSPNQLTSEKIWGEAEKHALVHRAQSGKEALGILKKILKKEDLVALVSSGSLLGLSKSVPKLVKKLF